MMDDAVGGSMRCCLRQRRRYEIARLLVLQRPADNAATEHVENHSKKHRTDLRGNLRDIGNLQRVWLLGAEDASD